MSKLFRALAFLAVASSIQDLQASGPVGNGRSPAASAPPAGEPFKVVEVADLFGEEVAGELRALHPTGAGGDDHEAAMEEARRRAQHHARGLVKSLDRIGSAKATLRLRRLGRWTPRLAFDAAPDAFITADGHKRRFELEVIGGWDNVFESAEKAALDEQRATPPVDFDWERALAKHMASELAARQARGWIWEGTISVGGFGFEVYSKVIGRPSRVADGIPGRVLAAQQFFEPELYGRLRSNEYRDGEVALLECTTSFREALDRYGKAGYAVRVGARCRRSIKAPASNLVMLTRDRHLRSFRVEPFASKLWRNDFVEDPPGLELRPRLDERVEELVKAEAQVTAPIDFDSDECRARHRAALFASYQEEGWVWEGTVLFWSSNVGQCGVEVFSRIDG